MLQLHIPNKYTKVLEANVQRNYGILGNQRQHNATDDEEMYTEVVYLEEDVQEHETNEEETEEEFFCSSCEINISSVEDHIREYHYGENIVVEVCLLIYFLVVVDINQLSYIHRFHNRRNHLSLSSLSQSKLMMKHPKTTKPSKNLIRLAVIAHYRSYFSSFGREILFSERVEHSFIFKKIIGRCTRFGAAA